MTKRQTLQIRDVSLFSRGGHYFGGEGHFFFPSCLGEGHNFFQGFLGEGHNFFKVFLLRNKLRIPCCSWFSLLTYFAPSVKEKMSSRQKQNDLYEFRRTILHLEGGSN